MTDVDKGESEDDEVFGDTAVLERSEVEASVGEVCGTILEVEVVGTIVVASVLGGRTVVIETGAALEAAMLGDMSGELLITAVTETLKIRDSNSITPLDSILMDS